MSMRGQSKSSDVGVAAAAEACVAAVDCEPPPNSALTRSPNGTEPDDDDVVPSVRDPRPLVEQPAVSRANRIRVGARSSAQPLPSDRYGVVELIDPAMSPAPNAGL
jgi:hypothetical protein